MLRKVCRPVDEITPRIERLLDDMIQTMRHEEVEPGEVYELINPRIVAYTGEQIEVEGCLSIPGKSGKTRRPAAVTVRAMDRTGKEYEVRGEGLLCRAFCHEIDHLDGKLFVDVLAEPMENK